MKRCTDMTEEDHVRLALAIEDSFAKEDTHVGVVGPETEAALRHLWTTRKKAMERFSPVDLQRFTASLAFVSEPRQ